MFAICSLSLLALIPIFVCVDVYFLHSERSKLHRPLAVLSAKRVKELCGSSASYVKSRMTAVISLHILHHSAVLIATENF